MKPLTLGKQLVAIMHSRNMHSKNYLLDIIRQVPNCSSSAVAGGASFVIPTAERLVNDDQDVLFLFPEEQHRISARGIVRLAQHYDQKPVYIFNWSLEP